MSNLTLHTEIAAQAKHRLRLWLQLLRATRAIEARLRERLRTNFAVTLPRFEVMAALFREPQGLKMSEVSRRLVISNGNVTGIVDRLVADGMVSRKPAGGDRRALIVRLSDQGRERYVVMAQAHERWVDELLADIDHEQALALAASLQLLNPEERR